MDRQRLRVIARERMSAWQVVALSEQVPRYQNRYGHPSLKVYHPELATPRGKRQRTMVKRRRASSLLPN